MSKHQTSSNPTRTGRLRETLVPGYFPPITLGGGSQRDRGLGASGTDRGPGALQARAVSLGLEELWPVLTIHFGSCPIQQISA